MNKMYGGAGQGGYQSSGQKFCAQCGQKLEAGARFCPKCGAPCANGGGRVSKQPSGGYNGGYSCGG